MAGGPRAGAATREDRAALARLTLARAEQLTGARSLRRHPVPDPAAGGSAVGSAGGPAGSSAVDRSAVDRSAGRSPSGSPSGAAPAAVLPAEGAAGAPAFPGARPRLANVDKVPHPDPVRRTSLVTSERPSLPVPAALRPLLPAGLRRGGTVAVLGSTSLVLALLAEACAAGGWAAVVGQPTMGLLAAAQAGVPLERLAVVPAPGLETPLVVAALLDGVDVVLVGPGAVLTDGDRRRLVSRARERGSVLLSTAPWPGADVVLTAHEGRWSGAGAGEGRLRTHEVQVTRTGRGGAGIRQGLTLVLPLDRAGTPAAAPAGAPRNAPLQLVG